MSRIIATALVLAFVTPGIATAQDSPSIVRGIPPTNVVPAENFTGTARVGSLLRAEPPARIYGSTVALDPDARTHWHIHPLGQTLVVTVGTGRVQHWGGAVREVRPGDVVQIPPGVKHWHGASPEAAMTHVAPGEIPADGPSAEWMEAITDQQYAAAAPMRPLRAAADAALQEVQPSRAQQLMGDIAPSWPSSPTTCSSARCGQAPSFPGATGAS